MWWDNWSEKGALTALYPYDVNNQKAKVKEYITNGSWDLNKLGSILLEHMIKQISNIEIGHNNQPDYAICNATQDR